MTMPNNATQEETPNPNQTLKRTPKVVTFKEPTDKRAGQGEKQWNNEDKIDNDEMVIKFIPEEEDEDSMSGLSRSIGKL